jgi:hypothetical protein
VTDLLKGLTGGGWASLFAWILPSAVGIILLWFFVIPELPPLNIVNTVNHFSEAVTAGTLLGSSVALGVLLSAASTPLYRILEGYLLWPRWLQAKRRAAHIRKRRGLVEQLKGRGWQYGLALEALARYPNDDAEVTPTRLGNAIRTFEVYGKSRFNLDSQTMWSELSAAVPKSLQIELDRSRALVDFFVAVLYVAILLGAFALAAWLTHPHAPTLLIIGVSSLLSIPLWYQLAITGTGYWKSTVQALVNIGRTKLAAQMGLEIPPSLDAERDMWGYLTAFVYYGDLDSGRKLDAFRSRAGVKSGSAGGDSKPDPDEDDETEER